MPFLGMTWVWGCVIFPWYFQKNIFIKIQKGGGLKNQIFCIHDTSLKYVQNLQNASRYLQFLNFLKYYFMFTKKESSIDSIQFLGGWGLTPLDTSIQKKNFVTEGLNFSFMNDSKYEQQVILMHTTIHSKKIINDSMESIRRMKIFQT